MADKFDQATRSRIMARVKGKNTSPEVSLRKAVHKQGLRYSLHYNVPGRPDFAFPSLKVAVFVDGCFWHGCERCFRKPQSNVRYWSEKIRRNQARDVKNTKRLEEMGWKVVRIWEHQVNSDLSGCVRKVLKAVNHRKDR